MSFSSIRIKGPKTPSAPDLTDFQKEVIFGSMLGDLSAEKSQLTGNTRLRFYMSIVNKDYILHLYSIFKSYVKTPPKEINRNKNKLTGGLHQDIYFSTSFGGCLFLIGLWKIFMLNAFGGKYKNCT